MADKMFADTYVPVGDKRPYPVLVSIVAHSLIIVAAIMVPVMASDVVMPQRIRDDHVSRRTAAAAADATAEQCAATSRAGRAAFDSGRRAERDYERGTGATDTSGWKRRESKCTGVDLRRTTSPVWLPRRHQPPSGGSGAAVVPVAARFSADQSQRRGARVSGDRSRGPCPGTGDHRGDDRRDWERRRTRGFFDRFRCSTRPRSTPSVNGSTHRRD